MVFKELYINPDPLAGGQVMMQQMEDCKKPLVAAISGSCMGGGLEVALACHYRIALDQKKTSLALPEVRN